MFFQCSQPITSRTPTSKQLTIFYGGQAHVFEDVPSDKVFMLGWKSQIKCNYLKLITIKLGEIKRIAKNVRMEIENKMNLLKNNKNFKRNL